MGPASPSPASQPSRPAVQNDERQAGRQVTRAGNENALTREPVVSYVTGII